MKLTLDDISRIASLARIEIDAQAAREVHAKLEAIFAMIDELQAVDTTGVEPMAHAQDVVLALREDRVTEVDQRARFQQVAPAVEDGLYLVPRVVEGARPTPSPDAVRASPRARSRRSNSRTRRSTGSRGSVRRSTRS